MKIIPNENADEGDRLFTFEYESEEEEVEFNLASKKWFKAQKEGNMLPCYMEYLPEGIKKRTADGRRAMFLGAVLIRLWMQQQSRIMSEE